VSEATNGWALQLPKLQSSALQKSGATTGQIMMERQANKSGKEKRRKERDLTTRQRKGKKQA
jgi:hypothetical protein